ncbi:MAG: EsaB/YukD family protein [Firmicutes bacterium]|nr:EsaB/YukD family protein [Bacillota bacterium]
MILIDVQIPVLDRIYDFELDEDSMAGVLMEEIIALISKKEHLTVNEGKEMYLYSLGQENVLKNDRTLRQQGICDGDRLILI